MLKMAVDLTARASKGGPSTRLKGKESRRMNVHISQ
jgi:hypothetical protein